MQTLAHSHPHGGPAIRPAATLMVVRDDIEGVEVLTLKRAERLRFLPGHIAFPGGRVQSVDETVASSFVEGEIRGIERQQHVMVSAVAALRETAEEIGCLLARRGDVPAPLFLTEREQSDLLADEDYITSLLDNTGSIFDLSQLRYVGRWITPQTMPARFDTLFFVTKENLSDATLRSHRQENEWVKWCRPHDLLEAIERGEQQAVPPTVAMLRILVKAETADWCLSNMSANGPGSMTEPQSG